MNWLLQCSPNFHSILFEVLHSMCIQIMAFRTCNTAYVCMYWWGLNFFRCSLSLMQTDMFIFTHAYSSSDYGQKVGGTCRHVINTAQDFSLQWMVPNSLSVGSWRNMFLWNVGCLSLNYISQKIRFFSHCCENFKFSFRGSRYTEVALYPIIQHHVISNFFPPFIFPLSERVLLSLLHFLY
jgi:hypothetical protein